MSRPDPMSLKKLGADYYKPRPGLKRRKWMSRNRKWIKKQMKEGAEIIDIGEDPLRPTRSKYYKMEKAEITKKKYPVTQLEVD